MQSCRCILHYKIYVNEHCHMLIDKALSCDLSKSQWFEADWPGASPGFGRGGGQEIFFSDLGICMSRSDMLRMAKPCALLGGFGGMFPRENFFKWCNLVRFRVYFDQILSLFFSKNAIFYIKINILDTHLLWGISREEIFENLLRLMRFGVYFETKMAIFIKK